MAIKSIKVLNVMAFQRQWRKNNEDCNTYDIKEGDVLNDSFRLQFGDGINVLIGENGVGKTTLLKMIYAATQWSIQKTDIGKTDKLIKFFSNNLSDSDLLKNNGSKEDYSYFEVSDGKNTFTNSLSHKGIFDYEQWLGLNIQSVFIPTTEMLSHSKGFLALNQKYKLPFDGTQVDIIVNASLPEAREIPPYMENILREISKVIDGTIIMEDDTFYVLKLDGRKIDFSLEAEGLRKLGLLWKLIRNGLLEKDTVLLWDEPEANLNPELFPLVVDVLLQLEEAGVQIFVATHSYNLAKYFEIRRRKEAQVMYHNLYRASAEVASEYKPIETENKDVTEVYGKSAFYLSELKGNKIVMADDRLLDEALEKNMAD
ncbi:MAG TPA: AAA family ATPase [Clostridiales bacterium]|nr:AAA family ATPase [Clostridiales bacterium]